MLLFGSRLERALRRGLASDGRIYECLEPVRDCRIRSRGDAKAIVRALLTAPKQSTALFSLLEQVEKNSPAHAELAQSGVRQLTRVFDEQGDRGADGVRYRMDMLSFLAKYGGREGAQRIVDATKSPSLEACSYWPRVLRSLPDGPDRDFVFAALSDPLPAEPVREALLFVANALALAGGLRNHPFDSVDGCDQLRRWLDATDSDNPVNATVALAFVESPRRDVVLATASDTPTRTCGGSRSWVRLGQKPPGYQPEGEIAADWMRSSSSVAHPSMPWLQCGISRNCTATTWFQAVPKTQVFAPRPSSPTGSPTQPNWDDHRTGWRSPTTGCWTGPQPETEFRCGSSAMRLTATRRKPCNLTAGWWAARHGAFWTDA